GQKFDIYTSYFKNTTGLNPGSPVKLSGLPIGRVMDIRISPDDNSKVKLSIGINQGSPIYQGTKASIARTGLVGDTFLLLELDRAGSKTLPPGSIIPVKESMDLDQIMAKAAEGVQALEALIARVNLFVNDRNLSKLNNILDNTDLLLIDGTKALKQIDRQVGEISQVLKSTLKGAGGLSSKLEAHSNEIKRELVKTLEKSQTVLNRMELLVAGLDGLVKENGPEVRLTLTTIKQSVADTSKNIDKLSILLRQEIQGNSHNLEQIVENLAETSDNLRSLTGSLKERPWSLIYKPEDTTR
ncbi:MAG: MCE family protein, partial [Deltaproteobacteria bacterium]|nr:MCE family protein [Deltaproteobacteria bacterium]